MRPGAYCEPRRIHRDQLPPYGRWLVPETLVQLTDDLRRLLDERAAREGRSRSALIRDANLHDEREIEIDRAIVEGYTRIPQTTDEQAWARENALRAIAEEPWSAAVTSAGWNTLTSGGGPRSRSRATTRSRRSPTCSSRSSPRAPAASPPRSRSTPLPCVVTLDNLATVPRALLTERIATLDGARMHEVCAALAAATGCA